jgi:hypothetical protein
MLKKSMRLAGFATALVAGCAALRPASSVADDVLQDSGAWLQAVGEGNLKSLHPRLEKVRLWLEMQSRWDDDWAHWYQGMFRAAVGYSLSDRATVWAGYTYLPTQQLGKASVQQQDVWPAFRYVLPTDLGTFTFRTMVESNFLPGNGDAVRVRPRQMIRFMHPLEAEPRLSLIAWDEVFVRVNTTPAGGQSGFDQNRAFAGAGWAFNPNFRGELGYMNQYLDDATHTNNTMHHLVMASLFMNW